MRRFLKFWFLFGVLGALVVWFGVPLLGGDGEAAADVRPAAADVRPATVEARPATADARPAAAEVRPAAAEARPATVEARPATVEARPATAEARPAMAEARSASGDATTLPWGVTAANAPFFDSSMHRLGSFPAGTPFAWSNRRETERGRVVDCTVLHNGRWQPVPVSMLASDLVLFEGVGYDESNPEQRDAVIAYFTASGKLDKLRSEAAARLAASRRNPHEKEKDAAKEILDKVQAEANEINRKIRWSNTNELPGGIAERGALLKRANEIRVEQATAKAKYSEALSRWNEWESAHPVPDGGVVPPSTPAMRELEGEMARLLPTIRTLVPGL